MKDIREFPNYRAFLASCYEAEKAIHKSFLSIKTFAERLGFSDSSLRMILAGKRNLTTANIFVIAKALKMSFSQTELFETIVLRDQASSAHEKEYYIKKIKNFSQKNKLKTIRVSQNIILSNPALPTLLVYLMDRNIDISKLSDDDIIILGKKVGMTAGVLKTTFKELETSGLLVGSSPKTHLVFDKLVSTIGQTQYIKQIFAETAAQIGTEPAAGRTLCSVKTFSIQARDIKAFCEDYKAIVERYMGKKDSASAKDSNIVRVLFSLTPLLRS